MVNLEKGHGFREIWASVLSQQYNKDLLTPLLQPPYEPGQDNILQ